MDTATTNLKDGLEIGKGGVVRKGGKVAKPADVPERIDLKEDHPLYGKRALRVVPAGMPDCTVDKDGRLSPVTAKEPVPEPKPEPVEIDERIR